MISKDFKTYFHTGQPVIKEFAALMNATFKYYSETHSRFFEKLPTKLKQSELEAFINKDLKNHLFNQNFCDSLQDSLKSLRRVIIRLEDLQKGHPKLPPFIHNLNRLIAIAERVEALYQLHWEYYRYQTGLDHEELVGFLLEIDNIGKEWDIYLGGYRAVNAIVEELSSNPFPKGNAGISLSYHRNGPDHFSVGTLRSLFNFLEGCYRFICAISEIDGLKQPVTILQVEVSDPFELLLAVPIQSEQPLRKMLQHLFLKNLLKKETLLKFVFEDIIKEYGRGKPLTPPAITSFQKELSGLMKQLPEDGQFTISNRKFPDDGIAVLQEFTTSLEEKKINYTALLKAAEKGKTTNKTSIASTPTKIQVTLPETKKEMPLPSPLPRPGKDKDHIRILTESV